MGIPQIIVLLLFFVSLLIEANKHGEFKEGRHNVFTELISVTLFTLLLYWGGFWTN